MKGYNTTDLDPVTALERHIFHRDQFAHYLRWSHLLKIVGAGSKVMDFGCGKGNQFEVLYRNRHTPARFLGLDIRKQTIDKDKLKFPQAEFEVQDLVKMDKHYGTDWDFIVSYEVAEHVSRTNVPKFLENISNHCNEKTIVMISTPCYDESVGCAKNHEYDGLDGFGVRRQELTREEMKEELEKYFTIEKVYGTFASQKDYKHLLSEKGKEMFDKLSEYYDSNLVSVIFAPLVPNQSRNCLWVLRKK